MIESISVTDLYNREGFAEMIDEYKQHRIKRMPMPRYRKEDYLPLESAGLLKVFCTMSSDMAVPKVVGFMAMVQPPIIPHYGVSVTIVESLFVRENSRKRGLGLRFIATAERFAKLVNSPGIFIQCPIGGELEHVLPRRGYTPETTSYFKPIPYEPA